MSLLLVGTLGAGAKVNAMKNPVNELSTQKLEQAGKEYLQAREIVEKYRNFAEVVIEVNRELIDQELVLDKGKGDLVKVRKAKTPCEERLYRSMMNFYIRDRFDPMVYEIISGAEKGEGLLGVIEKFNFERLYKELNNALEYCGYVVVLLIRVYSKDLLSSYEEKYKIIPKNSREYVRRFSSSHSDSYLVAELECILFGF